MNVLCVVLVSVMINGSPATAARKVQGRVVSGTTELWLVDFSTGFKKLGIDSSLNDKVQLMDDDTCLFIGGSK